MGKVCDKYCSSCIYSTLVTGGCNKICNYLLYTDKMRPCPPGEGCTVRVKSRAKRQRKSQKRGAAERSES